MIYVWKLTSSPHQSLSRVELLGTILHTSEQCRIIGQPDRIVYIYAAHVTQPIDVLYGIVPTYTLLLQ